MPGTALDGVHGRTRHHLQHFPRLLPDLLHPEMTGNVIGNLPERLREISLQQAITIAQHEILERIEHGCATAFASASSGNINGSSCLYIRVQDGTAVRIAYQRAQAAPARGCLFP